MIRPSRIACLGLATLGLVLLLATPASAWEPKKDEAPRHYDLRFARDLQAFGERMNRSLLRLERLAEKSSRMEADRNIDGVGVVVAPDRAITPAAWLGAATEIWVMEDGKRLGQAKILLRRAVPSSIPGAPDESLVLLALPSGVVRQPVVGFLSLPGPGPVEIALPQVVGQSSKIVISVNRGVAIREPFGIFVAGILRNGVPAFDASLRVVALCLRPTPDRIRTVAIDGSAVADFLEAANQKPGPAP